MARNEGIDSPFLKQPSARSPKLRIYESLFLLNESMDRVITLLREMEKLPFADKESVQYAVVEIEEVRCDLNADFAEKLADSERFDEGRFGSSVERLRRIGATRTMSISRLDGEKKNARSRVCRHAWVFSHIQPWPRKRIAGRPSKSAKKSAPRSAESNGVGEQPCRRSQRSFGLEPPL
jgi:hypothetical protein